MLNQMDGWDLLTAKCKKYRENEGSCGSRLQYHKTLDTAEDRYLNPLGCAQISGIQDHYEAGGGHSATQCHHINVLLSHIVNTAQVISMTDRNNVSKEDYLTVLALAKNVIKRCPNLLIRYCILRSV